MGCGPDNSAKIDRLNEKISQVDTTIDAIYAMYQLPRIEVTITPYAYMNNLSPIRHLIPFVEKIDRPHIGLCDVKDEVGKLIAIRKEFK